MTSYLLNNHCVVYICESTLSILSVHFQNIYALHVHEGTSRFTVHVVVGFDSHLDDELVIANVKHAKNS